MVFLGGVVAVFGLAEVAFGDVGAFLVEDVVDDGGGDEGEVVAVVPENGDDGSDDDNPQTDFFWEFFLDVEMGCFAERALAQFFGVGIWEMV